MLKKIITFLIGPSIVLFLYLINYQGIVLYYPFIISFVFASVFLLTKFVYKPSLVIRLAQAQEKEELPIQAIIYCEKLNIIWIWILYSNSLISFMITWFGNKELWALYNGFLSYIFIFGFMGIEYLYRQKLKKQFQN